MVNVCSSCFLTPQQLGNLNLEAQNFLRCAETIYSIKERAMGGYPALVCWICAETGSIPVLSSPFEWVCVEVGVIESLELQGFRWTYLLDVWTHNPLLLTTPPYPSTVVSVTYTPVLLKWFWGLTNFWLVAPTQPQLVAVFHHLYGCSLAQFVLHRCLSCTISASGFPKQVFPPRVVGAAITLLLRQ